MNPYGMLHSSQNTLSLHDQHHLSRMLQIPVVPQQLSAPGIANSAMRALQQQQNALMNGPLGMGSNQVQEHDNRLPVNPVTLDHHHRAGTSNSGPGNSSSSGNQSDNSRQQQQNTTQGTSSNTLEIHPDIVLDNFFEEAEDRPHLCQVCNASYKTRTHLKRHMTVHLKARPYTCNFPECGKGFNRKEHLTKHQDAVHRLAKFKCNICSKEISRKDHLNRHIKNMHTFPLPPGGSRRGQGTSRKKKSGANSRQQQQQQQLDSSIEPKIEVNRFEMNSSGNALGTPPQQHHYQNPNSSGLLELFHCSETDCSASFVLESDLQVHAKTHKTKPYSCLQCNRAYTRREKLTEHQRCYHGGMRFTCEICKKELSRKDHVLRHVRSVHPEVLVGQFEMAESNGDSTTNVRTNANNSSQPSTSSTGSTNSIPSMGEMGALLKSVCHICLKVFGTSYHLSRHVQSVHNQNMRPYSCSFCTKQFKRKDHLTNHTKSHCPSNRESSPGSALHNNSLSTSIDMNSILLGGNGESLRQHAINSLQIEMLTPDDQSNETENTKNKDGSRRRESSDSVEQKFPKTEKEEPGQQRRSCDVLNIPSAHSIMNQNLHHQQKRVKEHQNGPKESNHQINNSDINNQKRSPPDNLYCNQCQIKFNSEEEFLHHIQKHSEEKNHFHHGGGGSIGGGGGGRGGGGIWGRNDHIQNNQHRTT